MAREAYLKKIVNDQNATIDYTPAAADTEGQVVKINISATRCVAGVTQCDIAANETEQVDTDNIYAITCASDQEFSVGEQVFWDYENSQAVPEADANGTDDFCIGTCERASTGSWVWVRLNWGSSEFNRVSSSSSSSSSST